MSNKKIILATQNKGKVKEFKELLQEAVIDVQVVSLFDISSVPVIVEDGTTFKENAFKKAMLVCSHTGLVALADDSGLEVDYLKGEPGVHSARFAGETADDQSNNQKLLKMLEGVSYEKRTARFKCAICVMTPSGAYYETEGTCEGIIGTVLKGENGFGYDPLFYIPEQQATMAELPVAIKNKISHRAVAFEKAIELVKEIIAKEMGDYK